MIAVGTNVLVYAADADSPHHRPCRAWLEARRATADAWSCAWPSVYDCLRVTTHPRVMRNPWNAPAAWRFVTALLASPGLGMLLETPRHPEVAAQVLADLPHLSGNLMHDAHAAILMREHGIRRICTRDTDFRGFPFLDVIDPLRA